MAENKDCLGVGGGEGGIRTHGTVTRTTVFETALAHNEIVFGIGGFEPPQPT